MHDAVQPAGGDQPPQRAAQRAVTNQVGRRRRGQQGECLDEHVGRLVSAEPAGEGQPRHGEPGQRRGGQALHR